MSRKQITMKVNSEIKVKFDTLSISQHDGLTYLLSLYYGLEPSFIPVELERKVLATNIVTKDYSTGELKWNISLFEESENGFEWVVEWMDLFKQVNPERRGVKADVLKRMKTFFMNNPSIRKQDVFEATHAYLNTITQAMYCKKSHKFIYEQDGSSMLLDYIENMDLHKAEESLRNSVI